MSKNNELKWLTKKFAWRYIPDRYQPMVAVIVSGFLYYNVFEILFQPVSTSSGACGTLLRPVMEQTSELGWIWDAGISLWAMNDSLQCPRHFQGIGWEFVGSFVALAICGQVLRRAIKRDQAKPAN